MKKTLKLVAELLLGLLLVIVVYTAKAWLWLIRKVF
jgi:hypothetical protein